MRCIPHQGGFIIWRWSLPENAAIHIDIDFGNLRGKLQDGLSDAQRILDAAVMADTDPYVPFDEGTLSGSVARASEPGMLVYDTPYARRLFYNPQYRFSRQHHPLAGGDWFGRSKADNSRKWVADVERVIKEIR